MKKTLFILAALAAVLVGFGGCSNGSSDDNTPTVKQSDLYGSYWGSLTVTVPPDVVKTEEMCIEIKKDFVALHNNVMPFSYKVITFTDNKDGTWLIGCYANGEDTTQPSTHVSVTVDITKNPFSCKPVIVPMAGFADPGDCIKGKPYNKEFKG